MKRRIFISIVTIVLLSAGQLAALENKGPKIEIKEMRHDFGKVVEGTKVSHVFEVKNVGSEELIIQKVKSS
jgi:hypothetical protein